MEYSNNLKKFGAGLPAGQVDKIVAGIRPLAEKNRNTEVYKRCFGFIDLTSLNSTDSHERIERFVTKAVEFPNRFSGIPGVASVCIYPAFVETAGLVISDSKMAITSVTGGFPASQTYLEVKMLETAMAVENGADEIDVVISIGEFLNGEYDLMGNEIETLRKEIGDEITLKVILESGILAEPDPPGRRDRHARRSRFHQNLDRQGFGRRDSRSGGSDVRSHQAVRRTNRTQGGIQSGRRNFDPGRRCALLHDRTGNPGRGVAYAGTFPDRRQLAGEQPALGHRG